MARLYTYLLDTFLPFIVTACNRCRDLDNFGLLVAFYVEKMTEDVIKEVQGRYT